MRRAALAASPLARRCARAGARRPRRPGPVDIQFAAFAPRSRPPARARRCSGRTSAPARHTVTFDDGSSTPATSAGGRSSSRRFDAPGAFPFHCPIHAGMVGEVDVRRVTLDPLPPAAVPAGQRVQVTGARRGPARPVTVEADAGGGPRTVARPTPARRRDVVGHADGDRPADLRAVAGAGASETRRLLVIDRHVDVRATRRGVTATVTPALPGPGSARGAPARALRLVADRDRAAGLPVRAAFRLRGRARVRVVLVDRDGWTPVATSRALRLRS